VVYLDYAAATPMDERVLAAMQPYFAEKFHNPSAVYLAAKNVREDLENARHSIAQTIGARPAEIIMTAGATESINLAFNVPRLKKSKILISAIEHEAVRAAATRETLFTRVGIVRVDKHGRLDLDDLEKQLTGETILVSIGYANNEIGTVQPLWEIAEIVATERARRAANSENVPLYFHTDASQAAGYLDLNVARLGVDMMTLNGGKCYGPKQVGLLYVRAGVRLNPLIVGGGQESGLRSGTENVAGAIGFARALEIAEKKRKGEVERLGKLRDDLEKYLKTSFTFASSVLAKGADITGTDSTIAKTSARTELAKKGIKINGHPRHRLPNLLNFSIPGLDGERAVFALDGRGVAVATGSACAASKNERSHVLTAIGLSDELADGSLRISLGRPTTAAEIEQLKPILVETIREQLKFGAES